MTDEIDGIVTTPRQNKKGIVLAIISGRGTCPVEMIPAMAMQSWPSNTNMTIITIYGVDIDVGRNEAVRQARKANAKYIWFVDDDTVPPADAGRHMVYLLEQNPKARVVGGIYTTRTTPTEPVVYMAQGAGPFWDWKVGETFKCWGLGTGCMMIDLTLFDHLPEPWFETKMSATHKYTDDLYFCDLVAKHTEFEVWAHGGILCHHYDQERGIVYRLPRNSKPYANRGNEFSEPQI